MENVKKIDKNTISVDKVIPEVVQTVTYDYDFLLQQRDAIQVQKDTDNAKRETELQEINDLIAQADKLGIVAKVDPVELEENTKL